MLTQPNVKDPQQNIDPQAKCKDDQIALLKEKLHKYEAAANGANDGLWDWDFQNNEAFVSLPCKTMLGLGDAELLNDDAVTLWKNLLHPEDRKSAILSFLRYINGLTDKYREIYRLRHIDGSYRWILCKAKALKDEENNIVRISGSHTDITDQKKSADALKKSEEKYRHLFQNSLVAMLRCDADMNHILEANDKFWQLIGAQPQERHPDLNFFQSARDKHKIRVLLDEGNIDNLELQIKTDQSEYIWVSFSAVLYNDENTIECVLKDITQTKENLLELQKVNFELDSFVYHASHDLRSPLRSVLGLIDLYRMEQSPQIKKECINKIESSVKKLDDLIMELLSISRNDRVNDQHVLINLMVEINSSIASYYNATNTNGLEIITKINQKVPFYSDLTRVRIILNNLISNAIKYRSFHKSRAYIEIVVDVTTDEAIIKIEDNGDGIEESKLPHIFDMFYRATEKSEGSGLGLYIVKKVADKLNAQVEVKSEELEGTTFTIHIPNIK